MLWSRTHGCDGFLTYTTTVFYRSFSEHFHLSLMPKHTVCRRILLGFDSFPLRSMGTASQTHLRYQNTDLKVILWPVILPLASQSAQYLLSSSLSILDRMAWCCSFSFWAFSLSDRVVISARFPSTSPNKITCRSPVQSVLLERDKRKTIPREMKLWWAYGGGAAASLKQSGGIWPLRGSNRKRKRTDWKGTNIKLI